MKFPVIWAFAALSLLLFSCETPDSDITPEGFKIDKTTLEFPYKGGEATFEITSGVAWSVSVTDADWLSINPASGTGSTTVTVSATTNPDKENPRSAKLLVQYDDVSLFVKVTQEKNPEEPVFSISKTSIDVPSEGGEFEITVISDVLEYDITIVDSWIKEISREGSRVTGETIRYAASANEADARMGVVSVCTKNGSCIPVMVNQAGNSAPFYVHNNIGYRFTATWCGYCPYMDEVFHKVAEDPSNRFNFITFHASKGYPMYIAASNTMASYYVVQGFPTGVLNGWKEIENDLNTTRNANQVASYITEFESSLPCVAGISVSSSINDGVLNVEATVEAFAGDYLVTAFVLESGIVATQTYYPISGGSTNITDFVHDNVARQTLTASPKGDAFSVGQEAVKFNWSAAVSGAWVPENLSVAVIVNRAFGSYSDLRTKGYPSNYVVNSVIAHVGESVEMQYEK